MGIPIFITTPSYHPKSLLSPLLCSTTTLFIPLQTITMRFFAIASLLGAAAAVPALQARQEGSQSNEETITIRKYSTDVKNKEIVNIRFFLTGEDANNIEQLPSEAITCGESQYRFVVT